MVEDFDRGEALDWDGYVEDTGGFLLLDEGFYPFTVTALERERFEGSEKMAPCPRAKLTLEVVAGNRATKVTDRLLLSTKTQWRISQFFESLGFKKEESGKIARHWNEIGGRSGWIEVGVREYTKKNGETGLSNEVKSYVHPDDGEKAAKSYAAMFAAPPVPAQPVSHQPAVPQQTAMQVPAQPARCINPSTGEPWSM